MSLSYVFENHGLEGIIIAVVLGVFLLVFRFQRLRDEQSWTLPPPDEIIGLRIYPIKSCRGFEVKSARLLRTGFDLDRNWMFVTNEDREFITIRGNSDMTLIRTAYDAATDHLLITIKGTNCKIEIPAHPTNEWLEQNTVLAKARIWGEETDGWEYPADLTQPISDFLKMDVRLVRKGPKPRVLRGCGAPNLLGRTEATRFADMMPVLVTSMASMAELNERLIREGEDKMEIERFRPNVIIRGSEPWNEDSWKSLRINQGDEGGPLDMDVVSRCLRCRVPNVDPDTAEKHLRQPWKELMKYRRIDPGLRFKPSFGMLCVPRDEGLVEVGRKLQVTGVTDDHYFLSPMK
ncbi:hypothetical protein AK830_g8524 [Neonectria ditissima]|uniref:MOSC domain-containing protein n=1 Tax=Neonectria ditissima TaxID=78410 RepID=A0A0P7BB71_9HYPO|nr:hypothetical protein AK830_g8524 [Neonectria ditissima]